MKKRSSGARKKSERFDPNSLNLDERLRAFEDAALLWAALQEEVAQMSDEELAELGLDEDSEYVKLARQKAKRSKDRSMGEKPKAKKVSYRVDPARKELLVDVRGSNAVYAADAKPGETQSEYAERKAKEQQKKGS